MSRVPLSLAVAVLLAATTLAPSAGALAARPAVACGTVYQESVVLHNSGASSIPLGSDLKLVVNSTALAAYLNANWSNARFALADATVVYAWLESNASNASSTTILWLKTPLTIDPNRNLTVGLQFCGKAQFLLSSAGSVGEAPTLGATYGAWDDGKKVFPTYDDFKGSTLSGLWTAAFASGSATVNNGLTTTSDQGGNLVHQARGLVANYANETPPFDVELSVGAGGFGDTEHFGPMLTVGSGDLSGTTNSVLQQLDVAHFADTSHYSIRSQTSSGAYATNTIAFAYSIHAPYLLRINATSTTAIWTSVNYSLKSGSYANYAPTTVRGGIYLQSNVGTGHTVGNVSWYRERAFIDPTTYAATFLAQAPNGTIPLVTDPATVQAMLLIVGALFGVAAIFVVAKRKTE